MSQEAATKREKRIAARDDRRRRAATAQRAARLRQIILLSVLAVILVSVVVAGAMTKLLRPGHYPHRPSDADRGGRARRAGRAPDVQVPSAVVRLPLSDLASSVRIHGPVPPTGNWLHNLEHGAVAILYNCPNGCPELVQQLKDLYPNLPLGRNARRGAPRAIILPYTDMEHKIAVVAWGWLLGLDDFDSDKIVRFYESRLDRGPECRELSCP